jgi:hypothetical protein
MEGQEELLFDGAEAIAGEVAEIDCPYKYLSCRSVSVPERKVSYRDLPISI